MKTSLPILLAFPLSLARASVLLPRDEFDASSYDKANVITRDVVVIGGGSSGTHSAISLLRNGKTVVVVEQQPRLGGPVGTYTDPASKTTINYGLQAFYNSKSSDDRNPCHSLLFCSYLSEVLPAFVKNL